MDYNTSSNGHLLIYIAKGEISCFIDKGRVYAKENDFFFIKKDVYFKMKSSNCKYTVIEIDEDIFKKYDTLKDITKFKVISVLSSKKHIIEDTIEKIEKEKATARILDKTLTEIYVAELITLILRHKANTEEQNSDIIKTILKYIDENFAKEITLESISSCFSLSKCHFSKKFKSNTGIGINEYVTSVRISNAEKLLTTTDYSITEIAYKVGYNDSNYFSYVFKKINGITPLKYAKKYNNLRRK